VGRGMRGTAVFSAVCVGACLVGGAAFAIPGGGPTVGPPAALSIPVTASVSATCGATSLPVTTVNVGELTQTLNTQVPFTVRCSSAFRMGVVSSNGGMTSAASAAPGYTNQRDYGVTLVVKDDTAALNTSSTCLASTLTTSSSSCPDLRGPASAAAPGFRVTQPSNNQTGSYLLINGAPTGSDLLVSAADYTDTLTVTLSAAP
jgi:hypothetical protein